MTKYIAEFMGTCALTLAVLGAILLEGSVAPIIIAGVTLGLFVATIGRFSGTHINPAVTIGLYSLKKISLKDAGFYILAQFAGTALAILLARFTDIIPPLDGTFSYGVLLAEFVGTLVFTFGIASVVFSKENPVLAPFIIGGSLTLGCAIALTLGSNAVLNPAVAFGLGSFGIAYVVGPILGSLAGMWLYRFFLLSDEKSTQPAKSTKVCDCCGTEVCAIKDAQKDTANVSSTNA